MHGSDIIELLKTFSAKEMKRFGELVQSPFFNKNKNVIALFDYLEKFHPNFPEKKIVKEKIYTKICKGEKYNDGRMRFFMAELKRLAEEYLVYARNERDNIP